MPHFAQKRFANAVIQAIFLFTAGKDLFLLQEHCILEIFENWSQHCVWYFQRQAQRLF